MQLFIAKEQFGDYLNYALDINQIKVNLINSIVLPAYFRFKYGSLVNKQAKMSFIHTFQLKILKQQA